MNENEEQHIMDDYLPAACEDLTPQEDLFCYTMANTRSRSKAMQAAGLFTDVHSVTARSSACSRLISETRIKDGIERHKRALQERLLEAVDISREAIVNELLAVAFGDVRGNVRIYDGCMELLPSDLVDPRDSATISELQTSRSPDGSYSCKIKRADKVKALEVLSEIMGMKEVKEHAGGRQAMPIVINFTDA